MIRPAHPTLLVGLLLGLLLALPAFTCTTTTGPDRPYLDLGQEIQARRAQWEARPFGDYAFQVKRVCFCPPELVGPVRVEVRTGEVAQIVDPVTEELWNPEVWHVFPTIDGIFTILLDAVDRNADEIRVEWNRTLGHPTLVQIDYRLEVADEELGFEVWDVEPLDQGRSAPPASSRPGSVRPRSVRPRSVHPRRAPPRRGASGRRRAGPGGGSWGDHAGTRRWRHGS